MTTAILLAALALLGVTACQAEVGLTSPGQTAVAQLQQSKGISISLSALMKFTSYGQELDVPAELSLAGMPIQWMGLSFTCKLENYGPSSNVTDQIHGTVSEDGAWLSSLTYSRQVIRNGSNDGTFFKVSLRNLPLSTGSSGSDIGLAKVEKSGSDIQKFVEKIEYFDQTFLGGNVVILTSYASTDWKATISGQLPSVSIIFTEQAADSPWPIKTQPGLMGMG